MWLADLQMFFVFYRFVVPMVWGGVGVVQTLSLFLLADLVTSYWLAFVFQVSHVVENMEWPVPNACNEISRDWAELQVVTAQDYAHGSFFWTNFAGALNYQVVHHLFPNISQHYYPEIAPLVIRTCKEYSVSYIIQVSDGLLPLNCVELLSGGSWYPPQPPEAHEFRPFFHQQLSGVCRTFVINHFLYHMYFLLNYAFPSVELL